MSDGRWILLGLYLAVTLPLLAVLLVWVWVEVFRFFKDDLFAPGAER